jgi:FkbM family methyltransferase
VQSLLRPFGLRLARVNGAATPQYGSTVAFSVFKRFGFSPSHIVDVGANHGNWTRGCLQFFPTARYTLLEPQAQLKAHVQDLIASGYNIQWVSMGASDTSGTMPFFLAARDDSASFFCGDPSRKTMAEVISLDDLLARYDLPVPEMVKIDAEGFDLKVLRGAKSLLGKTEVFFLEAGVLCPFENSVAAAVKFMAEQGYHLIDITEINRSPKDNVLWLTELAFLRDSSRLLAAANSYE